MTTLLLLLAHSCSLAVPLAGAELALSSFDRSNWSLRLKYSKIQCLEQLPRWLQRLLCRAGAPFTQCKRWQEPFPTAQATTFSTTKASLMQRELNIAWRCKQIWKKEQQLFKVSRLQYLWGGKRWWDCQTLLTYCAWRHSHASLIENTRMFVFLLYFLLLLLKHSGSKGGAGAYSIVLFCSGTHRGTSNLTLMDNLQFWISHKHMFGLCVLKSNLWHFWEATWRNTASPCAFNRMLEMKNKTWQARITCLVSACYYHQSDPKEGGLKQEEKRHYCGTARATYGSKHIYCVPANTR